MAGPGSEWHPVLLVVVVENGLLDLGQHFCREAGVLNHTVRHPQGFAVLLRVNILRGRLNLEIKEEKISSNYRASVEGHRMANTQKQVAKNETSSR